MPRADRLFALVNLLGGSRYRTIQELAGELESSPRSIYRDLADLEVRGVPVERTEGRYRLMSGALMRPLQLTDREHLLLSVALDNPVLRFRGFREALQSLRSKIAGARDKRAVLHLSGPERSGEIDIRVLNVLDGAIDAAQSISILYTSMSNAEARWRAVDPWLMFHRSEAWYLVGRCHEHDAPRTFRLDRIHDVFPIGSTFERPRSFDVDEWLSASWGVLDGGNEKPAVIVFDRSVAPLIQHARHHPSETKRRLSDGRLEYRVLVSHYDELARWITGFGGAARVIEPAELVEKVRSIAAGVVAAHSSTARAAAMRRGR